MSFEHKKPFGKRGQSPEAPRKTEESIEARFAACERLFEEEKPTGDETLDEMISEYKGIEAFNQVAGVMGDMAALDRDKKLILDYLKEHTNLPK